MKKIILAILVIWISSCINNIPSEKQLQSVLPDSLKVNIKSTNLYDVEEATSTDFINAEKKYNSHFIEDTLKIKKQNSVLILPLTNNKNVVYKDTLTPESENIDYRIYFYLGHYPDIEYYLVGYGAYEDAETYLVDMNTGKENIIGGVPKISPQQDYLININEMGGMGDEPIGYQIWKFNKTERSFTKIIEFDQFEWYPIDFTWENDKTIIIKIISFNSKDYKNGENYKNSKDCVYKRLKLK